MSAEPVPSSAAEARAKLSPYITVEYNGVVFRCRKLSIFEREIHDLDVNPILSGVWQRLNGQAPTELQTREALRASIVEHINEYGEFLDRWVTTVVLEPRIVLNGADRTDDALHVDEIDVDAKLHIYAQTSKGVPSPRETQAMVEFYQRQRQRAAARPDGTAVSSAPVDADSSDGPDSSAGLRSSADDARRAGTEAAPGTADA